MCEHKMCKILGEGRCLMYESFDLKKYRDEDREIYRQVIK